MPMHLHLGADALVADHASHAYAALRLGHSSSARFNIAWVSHDPQHTRAHVVDVNCDTAFGGI